MERRTLALTVLLLAWGVPSPSAAGPLGHSCDEDGVPDIVDNCDCVDNPAPQDCDTDMDGYGNMCDCDLQQSGTCGLQDFNLWRQAFANPGSNPDADHNCDGVVNLQDFNLFRAGFLDPTRFSSGLPCAGTIPCP